MLTDNIKILNDQREMLRLDFECTAEWRESLLGRYPDDDRNAEAAKELLHLAETVNDIPDDLMTGYVLAFDNDVAERKSELLRAVGFNSTFDDATTFLNALFSVTLEIDDAEHAEA